MTLMARLFMSEKFLLPVLVKTSYAPGVDRKSAAAKATFRPWDCYSSHFA
jgi:hypothetical protein